MKFLQVSKVCCCANLRTGGLSIGYITLVLFVAGFLCGSHWANFVVGFVAITAMLYGIHSNRPAWMLPAVVYSIVELILCLVCTFVVIPLCYFVFWDKTKNYFITQDEQWIDGEVSATDAKIVLLISWALVAVITVIQWYIAAVWFSLYKYMKNANGDSGRVSKSSYNVSGRV